MSDVKIQINSAEALKRLLGEDTEVQMMVRDNIANDFVTNHIKPLLTDHKYQQFQVEVRQMLEQAKEAIVKQVLSTKVTDFTTGQWGGEDKIVLSEAIKKQIKEAVSKIIVDTLKEETEGKYNMMKAQIDGLFNKHQAKLEDYIKKTISATVSIQVATAMKEMITHLSEMAAFYKEQTKDRKDGDRNISLHL